MEFPCFIKSSVLFAASGDTRNDAGPNIWRNTQVEKNLNATKFTIGTRKLSRSSDSVFSVMPHNMRRPGKLYNANEPVR